MQRNCAVYNLFQKQNQITSIILCLSSSLFIPYNVNLSSEATQSVSVPVLRDCLHIKHFKTLGMMRRQ